MKIIPLLALFIAVSCILASGCVAQTKKNPENTTVVVSPSSTFTPFVNTTTAPGLNATINATNATNVSQKSKLVGPLRISTGSYSPDQPLPVLLDNQTVGVVTAGSPLDLMVSEGNHTVSVCVGVICPEKYVTVLFAKRSFLDFEEILRAKAQYSKPTVIILKSNKFGQGVAVDLEFINPTTKTVSISAEVSSGYSYIDDRTNIRMGDSVRVKTTEPVDPGTQITRTVNLYFVDGSAYSYDEPTLGEVTWK